MAPVTSSRDLQGTTFGGVATMQNRRTRLMPIAQRYCGPRRTLDLNP